MKMIGHIRQIKVFNVLIFAILLNIYNGTLLAQEARPTNIRLPEAGATSILTPEESARRLQDAKLLFDRGKTDAAIYLLQQLEKDDPTNYEVLFKLGEMAIASKNWAYSINVLRKASFIRPEDIEVRLILMDVYTAYQMPIQEIIVGKEILALDPKHIIATKRLAKLYKEQAMTDDEIEIRQKLKYLVPDDYQNLKRVADIFDKNGSLWEAARIYEEIRNFYPEKVNDLTCLASIYDRLGERFRELRVLDQIEDLGNKRSWLKKRAITKLRVENELLDPFNGTIFFRKDNNEEIDIFQVFTEAKYLHSRLRSSIDVGAEAKFAKLHHTGRTVLDGRMDIDSGTIIGKAVKRWRGEDFKLTAKAGFLWDEVHGRLKPSDRNTTGITSKDFPFLKHPSFNSYGGVMPVGGLKFEAMPGLHATYQLAYDHGQVKDLDARLRMFYFDKATLRYTYKADDNSTLLLQVDESLISDGNSRFHGLFSFNYMLWGSTPMYDFNDRFRLPIWRKGFFQNPPLNFLKIGYKWNYFDARNSKSVNYEVFRGEKRHTYQMEAQARIFGRGQGRNIFLNLLGSYSDGTTLDYRRQVGVKLSHSSDRCVLGLSYNFVEESATNAANNARVSGKTRSSTISAYIKIQF
ncbi:MAG: hypothetical protein GY777_28615 [Candidatus Brocadiaceae bacterium]|nr:hypothetical protein [Candidatus Brocadiaceae bacterium]